MISLGSMKDKSLESSYKVLDRLLDGIGVGIAVFDEEERKLLFVNELGES